MVPKDCSEVYKAGATSAGWYHIDTTGNKFNADRDQVYCEDGWTYLLIRKPKELQYEHVRLSLT